MNHDVLRERVLIALTGQSMTVIDIAKALGSEIILIRRVLNDLRESGRVINDGKEPCPKGAPRKVWRAA